MTATDPARRSPWTRPAGSRIEPVAGLVVLPWIVLVGLWILWGEHDGGYDADTWYWGSLVVLGLLAATLVVRRDRVRLTRLQIVALALFAINTAWSYLSMAWAASPGLSLQGSNRELLYLLMFALVLVLPWSRRRAMWAAGLWSAGIGALAIELLVRFGASDGLGSLLLAGRLAAPTGYLNATAALFTMACLTSIGLATRRELPAPLRGLLLALGCADLQVALLTQSRGWLFTLPVVAALSLVLMRDRLRAIALAVPAVLGVVIILSRLLAVYTASGAAVPGAAARAGQAGLLACLAVLVGGTLLAWGDGLARDRALSPASRRRVAAAIVVLTLAGAVTGGVVAAHGHPVRFLTRQWDGFSQEDQPTKGASHFLQAGSGRYDFWRVALDAFVAHPIGGLGQDNFGDYYVPRGRSGETPAWVHSLELRLLAHTGLVGFVTFLAFLAVAARSALRARRGATPSTQAVAAIALFPVIVWLVHGSVDWFWEFPALSGPALGLLAVGVALEREAPVAVAGEAGSAGRTIAGGRRRALGAIGSRRGALLGRAGLIVGLIGCLIVLGLPYLATREISSAFDLWTAHPDAALADLRVAARVDPLSPEVPSMAGSIALASGRDRIAVQQFSAMLSRRPGDWYAHFGRGLALSALGRAGAAEADYAAAARIDREEPVVQAALARVRTSSPLLPRDVLYLLRALS